MSLDNLYGTWDTPRPGLDSLHSRLQDLWHKLASQHVGTPNQRNNNMLTQRKHEIIELWKLFVLKQPKTILEIGIGQGGTLASWCQLADGDASIIAIDRDPNDALPRPKEPVHPDIANPAKLAYTCHGGGAHHLRRENQELVIIKGWTYEPHVMEQVTSALRGRLVDFMWHDCSHSAEMFQKDFELFWPLLSSDAGVFATHDIGWSAVPELNKADYWNSLKRKLPYSAWYEYHGGTESDSMGIGVIVK